MDDDDLEPEYVDDEDELDVDPAPVARPRSVATPNARAATARSNAARAERPDWEDGDGGVRVISAPSPAPSDSDTRGVVRPLPSASKPHVVSPTNFNDVQEVADAFKRAQPVIVNLQGVDRDLSRRLIDFGSGLCYGLEGNMERVTDQVFLLTPHGAEVSDDDRRRIREGGLVDGDR